VIPSDEKHGGRDGGMYLPKGFGLLMRFEKAVCNRIRKTQRRSMTYEGCHTSLSDPKDKRMRGKNGLFCGKPGQQ